MKNNLIYPNKKQSVINTTIELARYQCNPLKHLREEC